MTVAWLPAALLAAYLLGAACGWATAHTTRPLPRHVEE